MAGRRNNEIPRKAVLKEAANLAPADPSTELEKKIFDIPAFKKTGGGRESILDKKPYVVLKYFRSEWECFSEWTKEELSQFSNFLTTLSGNTWKSVYATAGKSGHKTGLGFTPYEPSEMESGSEQMTRLRTQLSPDIGLFELRVTQKLRVHGFQSQAAFFLVLLDREHRVFPE